MNILDIICVAVIALSTIICLFKGFKRIIFKICSFVIAMYVAKIFGCRLGNFLLSFFSTEGNNVIDPALLEKLSSSMVSAIGTGIIFIVLYIILRLVFKIIAIKTERSAGSVIIDRLLGAVLGLLLGTAIVFVFTEIAEFVLSAIAYFKGEQEVLEIVNASGIFKFFSDFDFT